MLRTPRLELRRWRPADREPFAAMNADPVVMRHFPAPMTPAESDALADAIEAHFVIRGFGLYAVEIPGVTPFAGFVGLSVPTFAAAFTPCVEIGWRLASAQWGRGYATEAGQAVLAHAWETLRLAEVVSFTTVGNAPSRAVMVRLGMTRDPADDFDHPRLPEGHPLRPHVLYRVRRRPASAS
jgi:RimJ/RimL family protein N-acetyltransferase